MFLAKNGTTTSGHFANAHDLAGYDPNLTNSRNVVAWAGTQNLFGAQAGFGPISSIFPWRSTRNFTVEANAHRYRFFYAEQHVDWQEEGRCFLNFEEAGFERAGPESGQVARDEVLVAVAQAVDMSRAEMPEETGCSRKSRRANQDVSSSCVVE